MPDELQPPPRVKPRIKVAPKIRQLLWCDFPQDAQLPEFWKTRPVLVMNHRATLHSTVTVVPLSTEDQTGNAWAIQLSISLTKGVTSWAICDKIISVAVSRLSASQVIPRLPDEEFDAVLRKVLAWLPTPRPDPEP